MSIDSISGVVNVLMYQIYFCSYHREHLYIIDVSQSVEQDHPYAFDFLRADITHVDDYFSKKGGIKTLGLRKTFEWIVRPSTKPQEHSNGIDESTGRAVTYKTDESTLDSACKIVNSLQTLASGPFSKVEIIPRPPGESDDELTREALLLIKNHQEEITTQKEDELLAEDQAVFRQAYIPQTLNEVFDPERDIEKKNQGKGDDVIYANVIGMDNKGDEKRQNASQSMEESQSSSSGSANDSESEGEGEGNENGDLKQKTPRGHRHEDRDAKKERKKEAKEVARERRKNKMPKAEKKKRMRNAHK